MNEGDEKPQNNRSRRVRSLLLNGALILAVFIVVTTFQSRNMLATSGQDAPER